MTQTVLHSGWDFRAASTASGSKGPAVPTSDSQGRVSQTGVLPNSARPVWMLRWLTRSVKTVSLSLSRSMVWTPWVEPPVRNRQLSAPHASAHACSAWAMQSMSSPYRLPVGGSSVKSRRAYSAGRPGMGFPLWPGMAIRRGFWAAKWVRAS